MGYLIKLHCENESSYAYVNKHHRQGWTSLMCACVIAKETINHLQGNSSIKDYPIINKIILSGASITAQNHKGHTALMLAASYGHSDVVIIMSILQRYFNLGQSVNRSRNEEFAQGFG